MRTTISLDDELLDQAQSMTGLKEKSALIREALKALIERESARRLARLGGTEPGLEGAPRRRHARAARSWLTPRCGWTTCSAQTRRWPSGWRRAKCSATSYTEVLSFITTHSLHGIDIGYVDGHLLAAVKLTPGSQLWTLDRRLLAAGSLRLAFSPAD